MFISQVYGVFALTDYEFICSSFLNNKVGEGELIYPKLWGFSLLKTVWIIIKTCR